MRLDKYLCDCNIGTRSEIKNLIKKKRVSVNGTIVIDNGIHVNENDIVNLDGKEVKYNRYIYIILNKPAGVVTARDDSVNKTVMDIIKENYKDLSPVGRLDKDTVGLLLITNDGQLNHNMLSPSKHVDKTYYVETKEPLSNEDLRVLSAGIDIGDDKITKPASCKRHSDNIIELTIHEGRFHQVKRMLEAVNNKVVFLKRISFGPLQLPVDLKEGEYRLLNGAEIDLLKRFM